MSTESESNGSRSVDLARALADPLRLVILEQLMSGPATVSELVSVCGASQPNVSNHLATLRSSGLVRASSLGRQKVYELSGEPVARLVEALVSVSGGLSPPRRITAGIAQARTCYDHLAGRLGVALFGALVAREAIEPPLLSDPRMGRDRGTLSLGREADRVFASLGVEMDAARRERRSLASYCVDWTERSPHLSGALGAAMWRRFLETGWVVREPGTRAVVITRRGRGELRRLLGIELDSPGGQRS